MKIEYSGNIYRIPLDFQLGFVYGELLDFSDMSPFDGILVQVFNQIDLNEQGFSNDLIGIKKTGVLFGPVPINKYPSLKGKYAWKLVGKSDTYSKDSPWFKDLRGIINKDTDWSKLGPWFKSSPFNGDFKEIECDYESIRNLETTILNHPAMVASKVSMIILIRSNKNVWDYYNKDDVGNRNMFTQIVNTYFDKKTSHKLLMSV